MGTCFVQALVKSCSFGWENYHAPKIKIFLFQKYKRFTLPKYYCVRGMGLCKNLIRKKSETRGKNGQGSEVELGVQRYPPEWKKMDTCPTVELGLLGAHLKKRKKKKEKKW